MAVLLVGSALFSQLLFAQQGAQSPAAQGPEAGELVIKSTVNRVILDVVVTDSNGKPVHGLTQKDFSLAEDGRTQQILSFDVHSLDSPSDFAKLPTMPANTFVNIPPAPERGPLYVLLLDLVNTEMTDEPYARAQLQKFITEKPAGTRFAIFVLSDGLHLLQGFTDDQKQLAAVLDPSNPRPHLPRVFLEQKNFGKGDTGMMVSVMTFIGRFLDGLPGRKNLLWFAGDFPLSFAPSKDDVESYQLQVKASLDTLAAAQVAVYPVDIRGVSYENAHGAAGSTGGGGTTQDFRSGGQPAPSGGGTEPISSSAQSTVGVSAVPHDGGDQGNSILMQSYMIQDEVAKTTGGHAFHSNNGLKDLLEAVVEDGANYYTVSYSPSNRDYNGRLRTIKVELADRSNGYQLAYRRSYYGTDLDSPKLQDKKQEGDATPTVTRKLGDSLYANMRHGAPMAHQIYFRAQVHAVGAAAMATPEQMANLQQAGNLRERKKSKGKTGPPVQLQTYVVDYTVMAQAKPAGAANPRPMALEIAAAAYDSEGHMLNAVVEDTSAGAAPSQGAGKPGLLRAQQQIDVPLSATSIRIAVRDANTDRVGAMEVTLPLAPESQAQAATPTETRRP